MLQREFPGADTNPIVLVLRYREGSPLAAPRIRALYDLTRWVRTLPGVTRIDSIVDLAPGISPEQYIQIAAVARGLPPARPRRRLPADGRPPRPRRGRAHPPDAAPATRRARWCGASGPSTRRSTPSCSLTGPTAFDLDFIDVVRAATPTAIGFIVVATYIALFLLLRSLLLPLKAIVMNLLSITASYGALVWIFQEGHLAWLLNFTPAPIETPIPLIMFCIIYGLSMDYEVLLLSPHPRGVAGDRRQRAGGGPEPGPHRPAHHRGRAHHGRRVLRLRRSPTR